MTTDSSRLQSQARLRLVQSIGAAVGLFLAAIGALAPVPGDVSDNVLARVNSKAITSRDLAFALQRRAHAGRVSLSADERQEVLNFLIDQELLIQRGVAIGLLESDRTVRKALAMAMIDAVVAEVLKEQPTQEALRAFYASHQAVFSMPARIHVQQIFFGSNGDIDTTQARAQHVSAAMAEGMSFEAARAQYGDDGIPLPDTLLPPHVLRRHLGPTLARAALSMKAGEISPPLQSASGYHILRVVELKPEQARSYQAVKQEVQAEYFRRKRDEALQQFLHQLRMEATILLSPQAPG